MMVKASSSSSGLIVVVRKGGRGESGRAMLTGTPGRSSEPKVTPEKGVPPSRSGGDPSNRTLSGTLSVTSTRSSRSLPKGDREGNTKEGVWSGSEKNAGVVGGSGVVVVVVVVVVEFRFCSPTLPSCVSRETRARSPRVSDQPRPETEIPGPKERPCTSEPPDGDPPPEPSPASIRPPVAPLAAEPESLEYPETLSTAAPRGGQQRCH